ncbi:ArsR/SmtB family transcription factor [Candidatus Latescibacterota bacterium]
MFRDSHLKLRSFTIATLVTEDTLEKTVTILKALGHPVRLQLVNILKNGECNVGEVVKILESGQPYTSNQLNILKRCGILKSRRYGSKTYYSLANKSIKRIVKSIII